MNILILEKYPYIQKEYLWYITEKWHNLIEYNNSHSPEDIDAIIINITKINASILDKYSNLKYIFRTWVGLDMVDLGECKKRNIEVVNTPWANADSVADITVWWIIWLLRKTYLHFNSLDDSFNYLWKEVWQNTVWIFWFGMIGKWIYKRLMAFWVKSFYIYDPYIREEDINEFKFCKKIEDKNFILKNSDIISLNLPLLKETVNFIWKVEFELLKNNVTIANSARWWIIEEKYLIEFIKKNKNSGVYLDVWENEPWNPNKELKRLKNCIITPHIWAMTSCAYKRMHTFKKWI